MEDKDSLQSLDSKLTLPFRPKIYWAYLFSYAVASFALLPVSLFALSMQQASLYLLALWLVAFILPKPEGASSLHVINSGLLLALGITLFYHSAWTLPSGPGGALGVLLWPLIWLGVWVGPLVLGLMIVVLVHVYISNEYHNWLLTRLAQLEIDKNQEH